MIFESIGAIVSLLYSKTEFEILLSPDPLSFKSSMMSSTSAELVGKKTKELGFLFFKYWRGLVGEFGSWFVRFVAMLVK